VDEFLVALASELRAPGVAVCTSTADGNMSHAAYGLADVENNVAVELTSVFKLASVTKQFTAFAIARLIEKGLLELDSEVCELLQLPQKIDKRITIRHLLNHTSGIPDYTELPELFAQFECVEASHDQMLSVFSEEPLLFNPGEGHEYSNSGYYLLGLVIERLSGYSFGDFLKSEFFTPLRMLNTCYANDRKIIRNRVKGYDSQNGNTVGTGLLNCEYISMNPPFSAGAICSTILDMHLWCEAILNSKVVSAEMFKEMCKKTILASGEVVDYGFGLRIYEKNGIKSVGHEGALPGFMNMLMLYPEQGIGITVLTNSTSSDPWLLEEKIAERIVAA
jgi:CubicO group peptidase (beta-lactamase class C family)